jgi:hypothetical protein
MFVFVKAAAVGDRIEKTPQENATIWSAFNHKPTNNRFSFLSTTTLSSFGRP